MRLDMEMLPYKEQNNASKAEIGTIEPEPCGLWVFSLCIVFSPPSPDKSTKARSKPADIERL